MSCVTNAHVSVVTEGKHLRDFHPHRASLLCLRGADVIGKSASLAALSLIQRVSPQNKELLRILQIKGSFDNK